MLLKFTYNGNGRGDTYVQCTAADLNAIYSTKEDKIYFELVGSGCERLYFEPDGLEIYLLDSSGKTIDRPKWTVAAHV